MKRLDVTCAVRRLPFAFKSIGTRLSSDADPATLAEAAAVADSNHQGPQLHAEAQKQKLPPAALKVDIKTLGFVAPTLRRDRPGVSQMCRSQ